MVVEWGVVMKLPDSERRLELIYLELEYALADAIEEAKLAIPVNMYFASVARDRIACARKDVVLALQCRQVEREDDRLPNSLHLEDR